MKVGMGMVSTTGTVVDRVVRQVRSQLRSLVGAGSRTGSWETCLVSVGDLPQSCCEAAMGLEQATHLVFLVLLGWDSDLQSTRPRAETKPAEELRSWEKKQRAPLRYSSHEHVLSTSWVPTSEAFQARGSVPGYL
jgi:hypothetical protein